MPKIPDKINNFNVYADTADAANKILGVTDEVTLPNFEYMSETLNLAGFAGEIDSPTAGQLSSATMEIPFSNMSKEGMAIAAADNKKIILRSAQEFIDSTTRMKEYKNRTITVIGMTKAFNMGSLKKGGYGNPSVTKEITYYKDEIDGEVVTEVDKVNGVCRINGQDAVSGIADLV